MIGLHTVAQLHVSASLDHHCPHNVSLIALFLCFLQELPGPCEQEHHSSSSAGELPSLAEEGAEEEKEDEEEMKIAWRYQTKPKVKVG